MARRHRGHPTGEAAAIGQEEAESFARRALTIEQNGNRGEQPRAIVYMVNLENTLRKLGRNIEADKLEDEVSNLKSRLAEKSSAKP